MASKLKLLLLLSLVCSSHAAEFNCDAERLSLVEKIICSDSNLSKYSERLHRLFLKTIEISTSSEQRQVLDEHLRWQTEVRNRCDTWICLHSAYQTHLTALSNIYHHRWQTRIPEVVLSELSRRSSLPITELKEILSDCSRSEMSMNFCSYRSFVEAEMAMSSVLAKRLESLPATCHGALQNAQTQWGQERDSKCSREADDKSQNISTHKVIFTNCQAAATEHRTMQLKSMRSCDNIHLSMQ